MGDEIDGLDLPLHEQSGNMDRNQISEINQRELQEQSGALSNVLESYYSGNQNFNEVLSSISDLGYSEDRARQIRATAQTERTIRIQTGHASDLAPNQLEFLNRNHQTLLNDRFNIHTASDGRRYIDDARVRELDGTPSRLYIPDPIPFNPLTISQQQEQEERLNQARPEFLEDFEVFDDPPSASPSGLDTDFNNRDRSIIDNYAQQYLQNPTADELSTLRENIGLFIRPNSIQNQNDVLNQFMIDIQYEAEFRSNNDGRPQLLSADQWDILRGVIRGESGQRIDYDGGLIYENERGELYYRDSVNGRLRSVPNFIDGNVVFSYLSTDINLPSSVTGQYLGQFSPETYDPQFNIRPERRDLTSDEQSRLQQDIADTINGGKTYRDFLNNLQNNYELSNQQFIDISLAVAERDNDLTYEDIITTQSYVDSPLYFYTDERGTERFTQSQTTYTNIALSRGISQEVIDAQLGVFDRDFQVSHTAQQTSLTITPTITPSLNVLEQIRSGRVSQEEIDNRFLERPQPFIDSSGILSQLGRAEVIREDQLPEQNQIQQKITYDSLGNPQIQNFTTEEIEEYIDNPENTNHQVDSLLNILPPEQVTDDILQRARSRGALRGGDPPIVAGQTIPILPSGEVLEVPNLNQRVQRYEQFFNSQQREYTSFRNLFRDILPIFSGAIGGYYAFSYQRSRERGTIQQILSEERTLLDGLQVRIENTIERLDNIRDLQRQADNQRTSGYDILERLNIARGRLAGEGDNPDIDEGLLSREVDLTATELSQSNEILRNILNELNEGYDELDNIQESLNDDSISRIEVNRRIDNLLTLDRQIMQDIYRYNPQILQGFQIGQTIGLVLSGYFFPTYIDIDDNEKFITADNINYNPVNKKDKLNKEKTRKKKVNRPKDLQSGEIRAGDGISSRLQQPIIRSFIPIKSNKDGTPLTYKQIQEYKSLLNNDELKKLKNKMLIFNDSNKVITKDSGPCKSVQGQSFINKVPIK